MGTRQLLVSDKTKDSDDWRHNRYRNKKFGKVKRGVLSIKKNHETNMKAPPLYRGQVLSEKKTPS
jgi:hypothetical protein